jgi:predicted transcriptional regulator YdeE
LLKLASMNNLPNLSFIVKNGELSLIVHDKKNDMSDYASIGISKHDGGDMVATFKTENIKMIPDDYHVQVKLGKFATFTSKTKKLKYFIVVEAQ